MREFGPKASLLGMLQDTGLLLALRRQLAWNTFRRRKASLRVLSVVGALVVFLAFAGTSAGAGVLAGIILRNFPNLQLEAALPGVILLAVALFLLISSFGTALGSLFFSNDLELLMTAPVDRRAVFVSKILGGMGWSYALVTALAVPALLAYGIGLQYGPLYYILALIAILGTPLLPAALGALLVMIVARFAPARRVREVLGVMGALFGLFCGTLGQTSRFWFRAFEGTGGREKPEELLRQIQSVVALPLPPFMAGRGLEAAGRGDLLGGLGNLSVFLAFTLGFFALCVLLAERLYSNGWVRMQSSGSARRSKQRVEQAARNAGMLGRASAGMAVAVKDWKVIPRDLRNFAQMLAPLIFWPIVYFNVTAGSGGRGSNGQLPGFFNLNLQGVFIAAGVLGSTVMLMSTPAFSSISREGQSWWLLRAAPLSNFELLRSKFLVVGAPFAVLTSLLLLVAAIWRHLDPLWTLYGWLGVEMLGLGMLAVAVALSVPWARLDWDDPRKMNSGWGTVITLGVWLLMALVAGGFLCIPLAAGASNPTLALVLALAGFTLSSAVTAGVAYFAYRFGTSRLPEA